MASGKTTRPRARKPAVVSVVDVAWKEEKDGCWSATYEGMRLTVVPTFLEDGTPYRFRWRISNTGLPMPDNVITNFETDRVRCFAECLKGLAEVLARRMQPVPPQKKTTEKRKDN